MEVEILMMLNGCVMSEFSKKNNPGGRPKKIIKQDCFIGIKCSAAEKKLLQEKAEELGKNVSEFLRELGLKGNSIRQLKTIPADVLLFTATLNHLAANVNQLAKKSNIYGFLNPSEISILKTLADEVKMLSSDIKKAFK